VVEAGISKVRDPPFRPEKMRHCFLRMGLIFNRLVVQPSASAAKALAERPEASVTEKKHWDKPRVSHFIC
jgi:hypothetical protein